LPSTSTPEFESRYDLGCQVGSVATCADDTALLVAAQGGFHALDLRTGEVRLHAPVAVGRPDILMNDGKCDPAGRFVAGTMHRHAVPGQGQLLRHDSTTRLAVPLLDGVGISNGLAWTASGTTFYCIDSLQARVDRLTYDMDEGKVLSRQPAFDLRGYTGMPDGMSIDEGGCLWIAFWRAGAVRRFSPDGQLLAELRVPVSRTTSCCFGGEDLRDLFITTARRSIRDDRLSDTEPLAGAVFRCRVDTPGAPTSHSRSDR
jgi:sugar lactone lactonase YvrE